MVKAENTRSREEKRAAGAAAVGVAESTVVHVGIDLGTNTSVIVGSQDGQALDLKKDTEKSVVGYPKAGIFTGILHSESEVLFGEEGFSFRLHLDLKWPLHEGFVHDVDVCKVFTQHLRSLVDPDGSRRLWGVVGAPANASPQRQKDIRSTLVGVLERMLIVPEPFLAAMGLRDDPAFKRSSGETDPTKHSLIVDIGAGTTDLCLVRGYFPTAEDQISFPKAGNFVDDMLYQGISRRYPDLKLTRVSITQLKEKYSFVGGYPRDAKVKVYVDGRPQVLDFAEILQEACDSMTPFILKGVKELLSRCDSDSIVDVMQNIILTGGGSEIHGLCEKVQTQLRDEGYDCARTIRPSDYKRLVARGGLKVAENVRAEQWQVPM
ncbi:MAG: rod shape-determining protein [Planctomycetes bacterium]|nr:rod shape-determining protein [Planctomycetota bacterium]